MQETCVEEEAGSLQGACAQAVRHEAQVMLSAALRSLNAVSAGLLVRLATALVPIALASGVAVTPAGAAAPGPAWSVQAVSEPTNFKAGDETGLDTYEAFLVNSGARATDDSPITIVDTLPAGVGVKSVQLEPSRAGAGPEEEIASACTVGGAPATVTCQVVDALEPALEPARLFPGNQLRLAIHTTVPPQASGSLVNHVTVEGGGAPATAADAHNQVSDQAAAAGFEEFNAQITRPDGQPEVAADSHPYQYTTSFAVNTELTPRGASRPVGAAGGDVKEVRVALPPGLLGNPTAIPRCTAQEFTAVTAIVIRPGVVVSQNACPDASAVGLALTQQLEGAGGLLAGAIYNLVPPPGMPAQLGFQPASGLPVYIDTALRSDGDYGITAYVHNAPEAKRITVGRFNFWGTPSDASHDPVRGRCANLPLSGSCPVPAVERPFLRLPSSCADAVRTTMSFDSWLQPAAFVSSTFAEPAPTGCSQPDFSPTIEATPTTDVADQPSGLHVDLHLPQKDHEAPEGLAEADLRDATVVLPEGLLPNPAFAGGLVGCSQQQVGYEGLREGRQSFSADPAGCPDASKIGTVEVDTPLLDHPLPGSVFIAKQAENPFGSLLAIYIAIDDPQSGVVVKLAGKIEPNPVTGQLTTTVQESPQLPFEDFKLDFFDGPRAALRTPSTCGAFATTTSLVPWTAPSGASAAPSASFQIGRAPGAGSCPGTPAAEPNAPSFQGGTVAPTAGAYSPVQVRLDRDDGSQNFGQVSVTLPPGATGKLAGIPQCSEAQIAAAEARSHPGEGALEQADPSCPTSSAIGSVTVGAGAGPDPFQVTGEAYLSGPYKGAPFSAAFVTPAIAGPFDLGVVVVRAGLYVDPTTAQVTTKSDPLPSILQGIPLDIRSLTVDVDRPGFTLNPTGCTPRAFTGQEISTLGQAAPLSSRFQAGGCEKLTFKPSFAASTQGNGSLKHNTGASLTVKVASQQGPSPAPGKAVESNIAKVDVSLPKALPSRLTTLQKACTEAQFAANPAGCPAASNVGSASANTPLLPVPLVGPAYLVSHGGAAFPDLDVILQGDGVTIDLVGNTQIKNGVTYSRFDTVPDAPISSFELKLPEGSFSALAATKNLCAPTKTVVVSKRLTRRVHGHIKHTTVKVKKSIPETLLMPTTITAQNGAVLKQQTKIAVTGCAKPKKPKPKPKKPGARRKRKRKHR
jgi:hypothetical protein